MHQKLLIASLTALCTLYLSGCASRGEKPAEPAAASKEAPKETAKDTSKAEKKISMAIGEEVGNFKIVTREEGPSAPAGFSEGIYTVMTNRGVKYKCSIYEPSGFMNAMSFGGAGSAGAMCTNFSQDAKQKGKTNAASCNDLLRAAGKC